MVNPSPFSSRGSTIVVDPGPKRYCGRCQHSFPETAVYFKPSEDGFALYCIVCSAKKSAARRTKKATKQPVVAKALGRKRKVLGVSDSNAQQKVPRLAPKEPIRWDMASQCTKEQMRSKAARDRENRYRRNNSLTPIPTPSVRIDLRRSLPFHFPPERRHLLRRLLLHAKLLYQRRIGRTSIHSTSIWVNKGWRHVLVARNVGSRWNY